MLSLWWRWSLDCQTCLEMWGRMTLHILLKVELCLKFCLQSRWSQFNELFLSPVQLRLRKYSRYSVSRYSKYPVNRYRGSAQPEEFPIRGLGGGEVPSALEQEQPGCSSLLAGDVCAHRCMCQTRVCTGVLILWHWTLPSQSPLFHWHEDQCLLHHTPCRKARQTQAHFVALNFFGGEDIKKWYSRVCLGHACYYENAIKSLTCSQALCTSAIDVPFYKPLGYSSQLGLQKRTRTLWHQCHKIIPASITEFSRSRARFELWAL